MVSFPIAKDTRCAFIVWIAGFVFVSDTETDHSEFPVSGSSEEISDARSDSTRKLVHEIVLMELFSVDSVRDEAGFKENNEASSWIEIDK
jgi:hypothetical protein